MKIIKIEDLSVGQYVIMTKAGASFPGLAGRLHKVVAIDLPYLVLETGSHSAQTTHMIDGREAAFAEPSREILTAAMPAEFALDAEYIEE